METVIDYEARTVSEAPRRAAGGVRALRVAVVCDLREEHWHSMNLVADRLLEGLRANHAGEFDPVRVCPPMRRRLSGRDDTEGRCFNADRLLNRFWDYPRAARRLRSEFDLFHIVDHSYAQLVHYLPPERTVVTCHDLDTFRSVLEPASEPRSAPFRLMTRRVLEGFRKAARVACDSRATRDELLAYKLFPPERVAVIPNGVEAVFSHVKDPHADREAARLVGQADAHAPELLHVGSTIARKRIDVLLKVLAEVRREFPRTRLVRIGGNLTAAQEALAAKIGVRESIVYLPHLGTDVLAAVYRRAAVVLQPSEREGFGLPVVEALACGTPVIASDIMVLREVGGEEGAVVYCRVGDVESWARAVVEILREREGDAAHGEARRASGLRRASLFTWDAYVEKVVKLYGEVLRSCV